MQPMTRSASESLELVPSLHDAGTVEAESAHDDVTILPEPGSMVDVDIDLTRPDDDVLVAKRLPTPERVHERPLRAAPEIAEPVVREVGNGYVIAKRVLDLTVGGTVLVATSPVMAVLSILTRLDSPGPAFFRQQRVAQGGKTSFTFYKYRTMYVDARERFPHLYAYHEVDETKLADFYYKQPDDPRVTRVGKFLRRTSLDELPNLINVVKGDLSLVGPRPEIPEYVRLYNDRHAVKFTVKPGATGLSVVNGRNTLSIAEQMEVEVEYVQRRSFKLDLQILVRTLWLIVRRRGAI